MTNLNIADQAIAPLGQLAGVIVLLAVGAVVVKLVFDALLRAPRGRGAPGRGPSTYHQKFEFRGKPLMNRSETRVFHTLRILLQELSNGRALALPQVAYGAFLEGRTAAVDKTMNRRRADFVVVGPELEVICVIEYQGPGHFGSTWQASERARNGDEIKRAALAGAGIPLIELRADSSEAATRAALERVVAAKMRIPAGRGSGSAASKPIRTGTGGDRLATALRQ